MPGGTGPDDHPAWPLAHSSGAGWGYLGRGVENRKALGTRKKTPLVRRWVGGCWVVTQQAIMSLWGHTRGSLDPKKLEPQPQISPQLTELQWSTSAHIGEGIKWKFPGEGNITQNV